MNRRVLPFACLLGAVTGLVLLAGIPHHGAQPVMDPGTVPTVTTISGR